MTRPKSITVVGWIWVLLGTFIASLNIAIILLFGTLVAQIPDSYSSIIDLLGFLTQMVFINIPYCIFMAILGILLVIIAIYFLKLHTWARVSLDIISWVGTACVVVVEIILYGKLSQFSNDWRGNGIGLVISGIICLGLIGFFVWTIVFLRSKTVREAIKAASTPSQS